MDLTNLLPLNLHKSVDAAPAFALVDAEMRDELAQSRWTTSCGQVTRSTYSPEEGRSCPQSLAKFVRALAGLTDELILAHANADLYDCRLENIVTVSAKNKARSDKTGIEVKELLRSLSLTPAEARQALGLPVDGVPAKRGRKVKVSS